MTFELFNKNCYILFITFVTIHNDLDKKTIQLIKR